MRTAIGVALVVGVGVGFCVGLCWNGGSDLLSASAGTSMAQPQKPKTLSLSEMATAPAATMPTIRPPAGFVLDEQSPESQGFDAWQKESEVLSPTDATKQARLRAATTLPQQPVQRGLLADMPDLELVTPGQLGTTYPEVTTLEHTQRVAAGFAMDQPPQKPGMFSDLVPNSAATAQGSPTPPTLAQMASQPNPEASASQPSKEQIRQEYRRRAYLRALLQDDYQPMPYSEREIIFVQPYSPPTYTFPQLHVAPQPVIPRYTQPSVEDYQAQSDRANQQQQLDNIERMLKQQEMERMRQRQYEPPKLNTYVPPARFKPVQLPPVRKWD
jgi:hypothetical protein